MSNPVIPFYQPTDKLIVRSKDCYQYDSEGKKYIDFDSGVWCTNLGHSNERIIRVMEDQIKTSIQHGYRFRNVAAEKLSVDLAGYGSHRESAGQWISGKRCFNHL